MVRTGRFSFQSADLGLNEKQVVIVACFVRVLLDCEVPYYYVGLLLDMGWALPGFFRGLTYFYKDARKCF